jgi:hypothetical protein
MSSILRMGIACAKNCMEAIEGEFEAISVGTSLGCLTDTEKFLQTINTTSGDILSPTAFIQSTHNTIAGQISLELKNHSYNMTHTQNSVSFETALLDGLMCIDEGKNNVFVGIADESIAFMEKLKETLIQTDLPLTTSASFMVLSTKPSTIELVKSAVYFSSNASTLLTEFLAGEKVDLLVETGNEFEQLANEHCNVLSFCGYTHAASALGLHLAVDRMKHDKHIRTVCIVNNISKHQLGITLLRNHVPSNS